MALIPIASKRRRKEEYLEFARQCHANIGAWPLAEAFMWVWLLEWAGAP